MDRRGRRADPRLTRPRGIPKARWAADGWQDERPWKAPTWLIGFNTLLAFVNILFLGAGAKVWGYSNALWVGFIFAALILPVFAFHSAWNLGRIRS